MAARTEKGSKNKTPAAGTRAKRTASSGNSGQARKKARQPAKTVRTETAAGRDAQIMGNPQIIKEAGVWLILAFCIFSFISYFGIGGYIGSVISDVSFGLFGFPAYLLPMLVFLAAAFLISNRGSHAAAVKSFAGLLLYVCISSIMELLVNGFQPDVRIDKIYADSAALKAGGGAVGGAVCSLLCPAFGTIGAGVILVILVIVSLVLLTQKSLLAGVRHQGERVYRNARLSREKMEIRQQERDEARERELEQLRMQKEEGRRRAREAEALRRRDEAAADRPEPRIRETAGQPAPRTRRTEGQPETGSWETGGLSGPDISGDSPVQPLFGKKKRRGKKKSGKETQSQPVRYAPESSAGARTQIDVPLLSPVRTRSSRLEHKVTGVTLNTKIEGGAARPGNEVSEIVPGKSGRRANISSFPNPAEETRYIDLEQTEGFLPERPEEQEVPGIWNDRTDLRAQDGREEQAAEPEFEISRSNGDASGQVQPAKDRLDRQSPGRAAKRVTGVAAEEEDGWEEMDAPLDEWSDEDRYDGWIKEEAHDAPANTGREKGAGMGGRDRRPGGNAGMEETPAAGGTEPKSGAARKNPRSSQEEIEEGIASVEAEIAKTAVDVKPEYVFPPIDLLKKGTRQGSTNQEQEIRKTAMKLQQTLKSFGVNVTVQNASCGPTVTRYELQPEQGVKVSRIVSLADDIKLNLAAADIRIEAPIPGKAAVGIEVPNSENSAVMLRDLFESEEFRKHPSKLAFATGKDLGGKTVVSDIAKMPHLLIAGATGSGKSVCINTLIMSILYKARPDEVKLIMIDPKVVELSVYNGIPHLFIPVVTDPKKAAGALNWGVAEMTDRYNKFAELGVRDLKGYNQKIAAAGADGEDGCRKLPQIVIIVDELADLMMVAPGEVEDSICRLAQLARAAGIHLVIATQRPSVNVITGLIKANMPSRIAFSVSSSVDSRTILDMSGAEKLLGKGDMLFYPQGYQKPARLQGAFVSDEEVADVVDFLKDKNTQQGYSAEMEEQIAKVQQASMAKGSEDVDALFAQAGEFIIEKDKASIGMLQRVFKIGFNRAARIMDQLTDAGVVGPEEGTKPRKVLMSQEQFENMIESGS